MLKSGSAVRKTLSAISLLWFGSLIGAGLAFLTQVVLARELTPAGYGVFAAALATVTLLAPLAGFGVQGFWLKVFGAEGWQAIRWFPASFRFVTMSTLVTLSIFLVWAVWGPHDESTKRLLFLFSPVIFGYLFLELVTSKLLLEEYFNRLALWQMFPHLARLLIILLITLLVLGRPSVEFIAGIYSSVAIVVLVVGCAQLRAMKSGRFDLKGHAGCGSARLDGVNNVGPVRVLNVARQAWPFGLATVFHLIYFQSDIILLKYISGNEVAGIYNVAFTIMAAVYLLPSVIYQKLLLPKIHRWANHDREKFYQVYRKGNIAMLVLGLAAMLAIWGSAFWAVPILFGEEYREAVMLLNILAVCAPVLFVASSVGATLVTQEHMTRKVKYMGVVALLNILLNFVLIPYYGAIGAAVATVVSNMVLLIIYYLAAQRLVFGSELRGSS